MHVLTLDGEPIATAERWERLSLKCADYSEEEQGRMTIRSVAVLD